MGKMCEAQGTVHRKVTHTFSVTDRTKRLFVRSSAATSTASNRPCRATYNSKRTQPSHKHTPCPFHCTPSHATDCVHLWAHSIRQRNQRLLVDYQCRVSCTHKFDFFVVVKRSGGSVDFCPALVTCQRTHARTQVHTRTQTYTRATHAHTYIHTNAHPHVHTRAHTHTARHQNKCENCTHTRAFIAHRHKRTPVPWNMDISCHRKNAKMHGCVHKRPHTCTRTHKAPT